MESCFKLKKSQLNQFWQSFDPKIKSACSLGKSSTATRWWVATSGNASWRKATTSRRDASSGPHLAEGDGMGCPMIFALFIFLLHWTDWLTYAAKTKIQMLLVKCRRLAT